MSVAEYAKALKFGEKEYRTRVSKGTYPYLPVLDDIISHVDVDSRVNLGLVEIPISSIVGTVTEGRTTAFASNFMPILDTNTEFAYKWGELYDSMLEEGLRTPIKAYEFNNKFYVLEGNKRVSVSKYMKAVSIEGTVTRVVPRRTDEPENRILYEFYDFYELTKINYVNVKKEGSYTKLLSYISENWDEDAAKDFRSVYTYFEQEFDQRNQDELMLGAGDALGLYLDIFGYEETKNKSSMDFKKDISKLWNEFVMYSSDEEVKLVLNPTEESKKVALTKLIPIGAPVLKIAFIHDSSIQSSAWTYSHELGRKYIQDVFGEKIDAVCIERVDDESADDVIETAIEAGNKVIFATTPKLCAASVKASINHPEVTILNCSMLLNHKHVRSYYLRTYEAKFILGAIAGTLVEDGDIGYIADYPIRGTTAEINAFALGVSMTNPKTKVRLGWKMLKEEDLSKMLDDDRVTLVSSVDLNAEADRTKSIGLYRKLPDGGKQNLSMAVRHWGKLYEEIIRSIMCGGYKNDDNVGPQALNYFWGMSSGAVDVVYSRNLPAGSVRLLRTLRDGIRNMNINPFTGPIFSQDGMCRCEDGHTMNVNDIVVIDWLAENIDGYIPDISELKEEAVELVKLSGIRKGIEG